MQDIEVYVTKKCETKHSNRCENRPKNLSAINLRPAESTEETDVLQLVRDSWRKIGVDMFTKPSELEVFRNRIFAGESIMSVWTGMDNGFPSADMSPAEFTPTSQQQLQWAKWGQFVETSGESGEKVDLPEAQKLSGLMDQWREALDTARAFVAAGANHVILGVPATMAPDGLEVVADEVAEPLVERATADTLWA